MKRLIALLILFAFPALAQQPQSSTAPDYAVSARYVQGASAGGYRLTAGAGLTLNVGGGTAWCNGAIVTYSASTLTMSASNTNYVYLNTASSCVPASNTTGFAATNIPLATVVAGGSAITSIADDRSQFWTVPYRVCSQVTIAMPTSAITSGTKSTSATGTCTGLTTSDTISCQSSVEIFGVTGFTPSASGILTIGIWPTSNTINAEYENNTAGPITPGALTINCAVFR